MLSVRTALVAFLALVVVSLAGGCGDPLAPACPPSAYGVVEGYVTAGAKPVAAEVELESSDPSTEPWVSVRCATDSTGWYSLPAPAGGYHLRVWNRSFYAYWGSNGLGRSRPAAPDTFHLTPERTRVDLRFGTLTVALNTPASFEGRDLAVGLYFPDDLGRRAVFQTGTVSAGRLLIEFPAIVPSEYRAKWGGTRDTYGGIDQFVWLPNTTTPTEAATIEVGSDAPASYEATLSEPWMVEGRITGSWQEMHLSAPVLSAYAPDSIEVAEAVADSGGAYRLEIPVPGPVRVRIQNNGVVCWMGGAEFTSARAYEGLSGEHVAGETFVESGIECRLTSTELPDRIEMLLALYDTAGVRIVLARASGNGGNPTSLPGLLPGIYYLRALPIGAYGRWRAQWYDGADSLAAATPIEVLPAGAVTRITMTLQAGRERAGTSVRRVCGEDF